MKTKTFEQLIDEDCEDFDSRVNDFIKDKQVFQITTNRNSIGGFKFIDSLTVLCKEE
ncbi:hypothetical protein [Pediococcus damnosus]|uniref:hypothetical protein n=1 Tax=Pediococcus damnosus TaxID=51663 RepID=UPI000AE9FC23|nr:hypothetical protein [Pediococcus damnosus]